MEKGEGQEPPYEDRSYIDGSFGLIIDINEIKTFVDNPDRREHTIARLVELPALYDVKCEDLNIQTVNLEQQKFCLADTYVRTMRIYMEKDKFELLEHALLQLLDDVNRERTWKINFLEQQLRDEQEAHNLTRVVMTPIQRKTMCLVHRNIRKDAPCICGRMNDF